MLFNSRETVTGFGSVLFFLLVFLSLSCVEKETGKEVKEQAPEDIPSSREERVARLGGGKGVYHTVEKGQTLWRICRAYGVDVEDVARANGISDPTQISVGQRIFIPGAKKELDVAPAPSLVSGGPSVLKPVPSPGGSQPSAKFSGSLLWPVAGGKLYSPFGMRNGSMHEGIDIAAPKGTPILAAADGKVTYSDNTIRGYGNMIVIKHAGNMSTVYAHNRVNLVKAGNIVKRGDKIAELGESGRATGPHLHFEVRVGKKAVNPMSYFR